MGAGGRGGGGVGEGVDIRLAGPIPCIVIRVMCERMEIKWHGVYSKFGPKTDA